MHEVTFRLAGSSTCARITDEFDARISLWCNDHSDLLAITLAPDAASETDAVLERIDEFVGVDDATVDGPEIVAVTNRCLTRSESPTVDEIIDEHGCLLLPPLQYESGTRLCRILALEPARLSACYRSLLERFDVVVESKRELDAAADGIAPAALTGTLSTLSRRQRQVFTRAAADGYYEVPRETSMEAIASEIGIDRRTADEHRRRAEGKLLGHLHEQYRRQ